MKQQIICEFYNLLWTYHGSFYSCKIKHQPIDKNTDFEFVGQHQGLFSNLDVVGVSFENCSVSQIPQGLTKTFPNLKYLEIYNSGLTQIINDDMKEYVGLVNLTLPLNKIPFLSSDAFEDLRYLEVFSLNHTKVNLIEPNIFDKLLNLKHVDFMGTDYINMCFSYPESGMGNATLDEIKKCLKEKYSPWQRIIEKYKAEKYNSESKLQKKLEKEQIVKISLTQQVGSLTEKISQKDKEINEINKKMSEIVKENSNMKVLQIQSQVEHESLKKKITEIDKDKCVKLQELKNKSDREIDMLKKRLISIESENKVLNNANITAKLELNQLRQKVMEIEKENKNLNDENFKTKKEADAFRQQTYDSVNEKNRAIREMKIQKDREIDDLKKKFLEINQESRNLNEDKIKMKLEVDDLKWRIHEIQNENEKLKQQSLHFEKDVDVYQQTIIKLNDEKTKALEEIFDLKQKLEQNLQNCDRNMADLEQKMTWQMNLTEISKTKELEQQKIQINSLTQKLLDFERENEFLKQENAKNSQTINNLKIKVIETADDMSYENIKLKHEAVLFGDFKTVMDDDEFKDFTIKTEYEEFKAHKFVLAARSPIFARVFKDNIHAECLNLLDISTKIFREILHFIYTDTFPQSQEIDFIELFKASEKLKIEKLKNFAARKLIDNINSENAFDVLILSNKYGYEELRMKAFAEIKKNFDNEKIDDELAKQPDKLKRLLEIKKMKNELMKELESEFTAVLKEN